MWSRVLQFFLKPVWFSLIKLVSSANLFNLELIKLLKSLTRQLNNDIQVLPDNDYYQNLSYSVKSPIQYQDSIDVINRLVHTTGLKNFVDVGIATTAQVAI